MGREEKTECHIASHFSHVAEDLWFPHHSLRCSLCTATQFPGESTVLALLTPLLPSSLLPHHCKLGWRRKPVSFQALKHPAKSAEFTESHLLNNSLNASGGQENHTSAPAVSFLHWLSPVSCQAPVLLLYLSAGSCIGSVSDLHMREPSVTWKAARLWHSHRDRQFQWASNTDTTACAQII